MQHYTIPDTEFYPALVQAVQLALARYPDREDVARLQRAVDLVEQERVTLHPDGTATVEGDHGTYTLNGSCPCEDAQHRAPEGRCKHRWARGLLVKTLRLVNAGRDPVWSTTHSVELRDGLAADGALCAIVCTPEFGHRNGGQHCVTAGR